MNHSTILYTLFLFVNSSLFFAQNQIDPTKFCGTTEKMNSIKQNPALLKKINEFQETQKAMNKTSEKGTIFTIPMVFHVLHNGGPSNISALQIQDAVRVINRDFRLLNDDTSEINMPFKPLAADIEIEFKLATIAPNGECFSGITRTLSPETNNGNGDIQLDAVITGNDVYQGEWPSENYLNIIVCNNIGGPAGYTFYPFGSNEMFYNAIFVLQDYVGSIGTSSEYRSRVLTHEAGHWFNLAHVWGDNNDAGLACDSDEVSDTPQTKGNFSCNLNANTCIDVFGPDNSWNYDVVDNVQNYMDYAYCGRMFTLLQAERMRDVIESGTASRANLITSTNLAQVGALGTPSLCKADFISDKTIVCAGNTIQFSDVSYNSVVNWSWSFPGGTPASSTISNPLVMYSTPGIYPVSLTSGDGTNIDIETKTAFINVLQAGAPIPYHEGFEGVSTLVGSDWNSLGTGNIWQAFSGAGSSGNGCVKLSNLTQNEGDLDFLESKQFDLSDADSTSGITLSFRYAFRKQFSSNSDQMRLFVTKNCNSEWIPRKTLTSSTMSGSLNQIPAYTPTVSQWTTVHVTNITEEFWTENFRFRFEFKNGGGNNIFLDDINLYSGPPSETLVLGTEENLGFSQMSLFPNPSDGNVEFVFSHKTGAPMNINFLDITGKTISTFFIQANQGTNLVLLDTESFAQGTYFIQVNDGIGTEQLRFVKK